MKQVNLFRVGNDLFAWKRLPVDNARMLTWEDMCSGGGTHTATLEQQNLVVGFSWLLLGFGNRSGNNETGRVPELLLWFTCHICCFVQRQSENMSAPTNIAGLHKLNKLPSGCVADGYLTTDGGV